MNAERLLEHFERISEAPDAIARLRRFILDLAVRGKLVEQDPEDEPAEGLSKIFKAEKAWLAKTGQIRNQKQLSEINHDDFPMVQGWLWERLGFLSIGITKGSTPTSYGHAYTEAGVSFVKVESIKDGALRPSGIKSFISPATHEFLSRSRLEAGDILFSIAGSIGTCAIVEESILPANTNQALAIIRGTQMVFNPGFLLAVLRSSLAHSVLLKARGVAMNNVSLDDIQNLVVPLPPLAEQHRIVAKVDELMALCDQLEAARQQREQRRECLLAATLQRLNQPAEDTSSFRKDARFALQVLPSLTTTPAQIKQLRQTILNLAVRGKLMEQDPEDEPAEELLKAISLDSSRSKGRGKAASPSPVIATKGSFLVPDSWVWTLLGSIGEWGSGSTPPRGRLEYYGGYISWFKSGELSDNKCLSNSDEKITRLALEQCSFRQNKPGDVLIAMYGATIGRLAILAEEAVTNQAVCACTPCWGVDNDYLYLFLLAKRDDFRLASEGGAQPNISKVKILNTVIPIPPLAEQHRIVAKVDELMALCDQLEQQLSQADQQRRRLLEAVLAEALN